jgi:hypothetical protein
MSFPFFSYKDFVFEAGAAINGSFFFSIPRREKLDLKSVFIFCSDENIKLDCTIENAATGYIYAGDDTPAEMLTTYKTGAAVAPVISGRPYSTENTKPYEINAPFRNTCFIGGDVLKITFHAAGVVAAAPVLVQLLINAEKQGAS